LIPLNFNPFKLINSTQAPLFIGGIGGSGTRIFAQIAQHAGLFMGTKLNKALDSRTFGPVYGRWCGATLRSNNILPWYQRFARDIDFSIAQIRHCAALPSLNQPWGAKNPRTILMLPYLSLKFPEMKFLHVLRDGRDMAFSKNQNQLLKYGEILLDSEGQSKLPQPVRAIKFWGLINGRASHFGESKMQNRYMRVNFEDLCNDPLATLGRIFDFLDNPSADLGAFVAEVQKPPTIGRWRNYDPDTVSQVINAGRAMLEQFGYLDA
jgi:hypothetical protein